MNALDYISKALPGPQLPAMIVMSGKIQRSSGRQSYDSTGACSAGACSAGACSAGAGSAGAGSAGAGSAGAGSAGAGSAGAGSAGAGSAGAGSAGACSVGVATATNSASSLQWKLNIKCILLGPQFPLIPNLPHGPPLPRSRVTTEVAAGRILQDSVGRTLQDSAGRTLEQTPVLVICYHAVAKTPSTRGRKPLSRRQLEAWKRTVVVVKEVCITHTLGRPHDGDSACRAEQPPAEQAPAEQAPAEQAPAEQAPAEPAPAEQAPVAQLMECSGNQKNNHTPPDHNGLSLFIAFQTGQTRHNGAPCDDQECDCTTRPQLSAPSPFSSSFHLKWTACFPSPFPPRNLRFLTSTSHKTPV
ncbi:hypothetical protein FHG87_022992 [Trinorchestia longiramus]|nr:hypothetical protein FHG87_022992 [Trinorchestia longiramus]